MYDECRPQSSSDERQRLQDTAPAEIPVLDGATPPVPPAECSEMIIVMGMSGARRSHAANALEDLDWYVVDSLPPQLLPALSGIMTTADAGVHRLAAVVDVYNRELFSHFMDYLRKVRNNDINVRLVFPDTSDAVLVRHFESSRHPHPSRDNGSVLDGIEHERTLLGGLRGVADSVIDTSNCSVHDLARRVRELVAREPDLVLRINVMPSEFKYGIPLDADHILDMHFTPDSYRVFRLRYFIGRNAPVADYVFTQRGVAAFVGGHAGLLTPTLPQCVNELKPHVTLTVDCTGGEHHSVASAERFGARLRRASFKVVVQHRNLGRE